MDILTATVVVALCLALLYLLQPAEEGDPPRYKLFFKRRVVNTTSNIPENTQTLADRYVDLQSPKSFRQEYYETFSDPADDLENFVKAELKKPNTVIIKAPKKETTEIVNIIAETAWENPPGQADRLLAHLRSIYAEYGGTTPKYLIPLVWTAAEDISPDLSWAKYTDDASPNISKVNHISITGSSETGKDAFIRMICLTLALQHGPAELEFWIIDGKGSMILLSRLKATRAYAGIDEIPFVFEQINNERLRRQEVINNQSLKDLTDYSWDTLPDQVKQENNMTALAVVIITEILLLQGSFSTTKEFDNQLTRLMVSARSAGMRIILSGQKFNRMGTSWRTMVGLYISAAQGFPDDDEPNTGATTATIRSLGAVPPSQLDANTHRGVFTIVQSSGQLAITGRASYFDRDETRRILETLPLRAMEDMKPAAPPAENKTAHEQRVQKALAFLRGLDISKDKKINQSFYEKEIFGSTGGPYWAAVSEALRIIAEESTPENS